MKKVADHVSIPLASGESNYGIYEFKELIERQALDFVQPDICCCGGVLTMKKSRRWRRHNTFWWRRTIR